MQRNPGGARSQVALVQDGDESGGRYENISHALRLLSQTIDLAGKRQVLIKPNFVMARKPLACTHADAVRAVLDFVRARYDGPLTIAEGPSAEPAADAFRLLGYEPLARAYDAALVDLNHDKPLPVEVYDWRMQPLHLQLARSVVESDFRISVGPPKTHDVVIVTLSLKNMIMGSLISRLSQGFPSQKGSSSPMRKVSQALWRLMPQWIRGLPPAEWLEFRAMSTQQSSDKMKMHQSYPVINLNLALLAPLVVPHLAVLDGYEAMEGNGPSAGTMVPWRLALASTDALAADVVGTTLMGFSVDNVGYLNYCRQMGLGVSDLSQIEIVGNASVVDCTRSFQPHTSYHRQLGWEMHQSERYLTWIPNLP